MTTLPAQRVESTPLDDGTDHVALVIHFRDPDTGAEWREHHPRMRVEDHGIDEDGQHRYTFHRVIDPETRRMLDRFFGDDLVE